jgi:alpha-galactosidase
MAIIFDEQNKTFTIHTEHSTYQMQIDPYGVLLHLYYGRKTKGCMDYLLQKQDRGFSGNLYDAGNDRTYSLDVLPQEFPTWGTGRIRGNVRFLNLFHPVAPSIAPASYTSSGTVCRPEI